MINERFTSYFREKFFGWKEEEFQSFLATIEKWIPRTIRIKPGKEEIVKKHLESDGWILTPTNIVRVYSLDRREDFNPLDRRIGYTIDHLIGNFYIQELAATHPVDILAESRIRDEEFLILDMASSPGGKTTQLAEYFPNSFIIANEPTRERIPQLLQNLERMGSASVAITLYPWQQWRSAWEIWDRILLDAPCSGEGTLYKWTDAVRHWHIKNIKKIAQLQEKLLESSLHSLKVWGEMVYSTCALNDLENEWVVNTMIEKYGEHIEILYEQKFWPHITGTGGFFITRLRKISSLSDSRVHWPKNTNDKLAIMKWELIGWKSMKNITLYIYGEKVLAVKNAHIGESLRSSIYSMRWWEPIGTIEHGKLIPYYQAYRYLETDHLPIYTITGVVALDRYLRWEPIAVDNSDYSGYITLTYDSEIIALAYQDGEIIHNRFPREWQRK
jgi:16S rRNA C967 or C1407 C5-methylase (RsmB/RsmF family)